MSILMRNTVAGRSAHSSLVKVEGKIMKTAILIGIAAGLLFGVILVWEGAGAAGLVLLFALIGLLIGVLGMVVVRILSGDVDGAELKSLFSSVMNGKSTR